jgi:low affinity Fe/Cu permease
MNQEQYLADRVEDQINWYDKKSQTNQKYFKNIRLMEIVCAATIPFIAGMGNSVPYGSIILGVLGVIIAVSAGFSALSKHQENWLMYRTTCETIKHEKYLFLTQSKPYNDDTSFNQFVERIESLISKENSQWSRVSKEKTHNKPIKRD